MKWALQPFSLLLDGVAPAEGLQLRDTAHMGWKEWCLTVQMITMTSDSQGEKSQLSEIQVLKKEFAYFLSHTYLTTFIGPPF